MALSVSSFPENICIPPPEDGFNTPSEPSSSNPTKKRRIFGNLFSKEGSPIFRAPRRQHSASFTSRGNAIAEPDSPPVMSISAQNASAEVVLDLAAPVNPRAKPRLPTLAVPSSSHLPPPAASPHDGRDLAFPPTPVATEHDRPNPMKESIKALRLSRIHRPIDWARKPEDDALPPWASRGVIASFGHPDQYLPGDGDRNRMSSGTTSSSPWSASARYSTRPSVTSSSSPSSRTSSMYWSSATAATSPSSATSKSRNPRPRTPSDPSSSNGFRPVSTSSSKSGKSSKSTRSTKATPAPPAQLSGTATMRLRSLSTSSDKGKSPTSPLTTASPTDVLHKRSRSNASDDNQKKTRPLPLPTATDPRPRARSLSSPEDKGKGKQKATPGVRPLPSLEHASSPEGMLPSPPPVPLSAPAVPRRSGSMRGIGSVWGPRSRPTTPSSRSRPTTPSSRSRPTTPSRDKALPTMPFPGKIAPSPIQVLTSPVGGASGLGHKPSLPTLNSLPAPTPGRKPSLPIIHAPAPVAPSTAPPFLGVARPTPSPEPSSSTTPDANGAHKRTASFGLSSPTVWGPPSGIGSRRTSTDAEEGRRDLVVVTTRDGRGSEVQETDAGDVIRRLRDLKTNR